MSALGQKQTFAPQNFMSALPPKADIRASVHHVRYGPIADICCAKRACPALPPKADIPVLLILPLVRKITREASGQLASTAFLGPRVRRRELDRHENEI